MTHKLLIIDPQNDFCDIPGAALPTQGADADMRRVAQFLSAVTPADLSDLIVTLDWHEPVAIERVSFWKDADGNPVAPFTEITEATVRAGRFVPRNPALLKPVLFYLRRLEEGRRYRLIVWPVHCVQRSWGAEIHAALAAEISRWETSAGREAIRIYKGMSTMTEHYSAVRAEVMNPDEPATEYNINFVTSVIPRDGEKLLIAGETASHCVPSTVLDLFKVFSPEERRRVVLLKDCMSPVSGFERAAQDFYTAACELGARVRTSTEMVAEITR